MTNMKIASTYKAANVEYSNDSVVINTIVTRFHRVEFVIGE